MQEIEDTMKRTNVQFVGIENGLETQVKTRKILSTNS